MSITDNAGGNPQLAPLAVGTPILYAGKEVVIHLTCKDLNRHALESQLWLLGSQGFHNVLAMTGDYPVESFGGRAKPVFDIDSVALLAMITRLNAALEVAAGARCGQQAGLDPLLRRCGHQQFQGPREHPAAAVLQTGEKVGERRAVHHQPDRL